MKNYITRDIEVKAVEASLQYPVLTILGPRQSGKTTLVKRLFPNHSYVNLELPDDRLLAAEDPYSFFKRYREPLVIDEIQRAPGLLSHIQVLVDEDRGRKGRFILTGSQQLDLRQAVTQSLAGRTALLKLLSLSIAEIEASGLHLERDGYLFHGLMPGIYEESLPPSSSTRAIGNRTSRAVGL